MIEFIATVTVLAVLMIAGSIIFGLLAVKSEGYDIDKTDYGRYE